MFTEDRFGNMCEDSMENSTIINDQMFIVTQCNATLNGTESSLQDCTITTIGSCPCDNTARLQCQPGTLSCDIQYIHKFIYNQI